MNTVGIDVGAAIKDRARQTKIKTDKLDALKLANLLRGRCGFYNHQ